MRELWSRKYGYRLFVLKVIADLKNEDIISRKPLIFFFFFLLTKRGSEKFSTDKGLINLN